MTRALLRRLNKHGLNLVRVELGRTAPTYPPIYVVPSAAPSGTAQEGDVYHDSTAHAPEFYDGSNWQQVAGLGAAQSWTGVQTFSVAPVFSVAASGPMPKRPVKNGVTILTAADNGATCVWGTAAGYLYTLPTAAAGLWFEFVVAVTITSVGAKVLTASASEFILGSFLQIPDTAAQTVAQNANGTTIRSWTGNGSTTGGFAGDSFVLRAISATQWVIDGIGLATGTEATPFATS